MGQVKLDIGGRSFIVSCQDGEETHLTKLAAMLDEKAGEAGDPAGLTESRMLLFTSLLLADDLHSAKSATAPTNTPEEQNTSNPDDEQIILTLEKLAGRIEDFASSLEQIDIHA